MKDKNIDAVKTIRKIRDKSSIDYFTNKKKWLKDLSNLQGVSIKEDESKSKNHNKPAV